MKCIYCGEEFEQKSKKGIRKNYCDKIECKKKKQAEKMKKYYQKKKLGLPIRQHKANNKKENQVQVEENIQEPMQLVKNDFVRMYREDEIIYVKNLLPVADEMAMEVLDFARRLGALRYEGEALKIKLSKQTSENDLNDSKFLHAIESAQQMTVGDIIKLFVGEGKSRSQRRDTKSLHSIVHCLINGIPANPHEYAQKTIRGIAKANVTYAIKNEESKLKNEKEAN